MKYMLLIFSDPAAYSDPAEAQKMMGDYMSFTQAITDSGEFVSGDPLQAPDTATAVRVRSGQVSTTDGPFVETKEFLGGYYVVDVKDLDRAIEVAAQIPDARMGVVEVRPLMDFPG
jgi:hypothetical protein